MGGPCPMGRSPTGSRTGSEGGPARTGERRGGRSTTRSPPSIASMRHGFPTTPSWPAGWSSADPGQLAVQEVWDRWSGLTGRSVADIGYWKAFGGTVLTITCTRWLRMWGFAEPAQLEGAQPLARKLGGLDRGGILLTARILMFIFMD
jgi:hypothetical protein